MHIHTHAMNLSNTLSHTHKHTRIKNYGHMHTQIKNCGHMYTHTLRQTDREKETEGERETYALNAAPSKYSCSWSCSNRRLSLCCLEHWVLSMASAFFWNSFTMFCTHKHAHTHTHIHTHTRIHKHAHTTQIITWIKVSQTIEPHVCWTVKTKGNKIQDVHQATS